jgi:hypothetical protein
MKHYVFSTGKSVHCSFIHLAHHQKRTQHGNNTDEKKKNRPNTFTYSLELEAFTSLSLQNTRRGDYNFFWSSATSKTIYRLFAESFCEFAIVPQNSTKRLLLELWWAGRKCQCVRAVCDLFVLQNDRATVSSALLQFLLLFPQQLLAAIL